MRLLGVNKRITEGKGEERKGHEEEISKEEVKVIFKKIKEGKATGIDGIPGETWKYGGEKTMKWTWIFCNRIWKEEGWQKSGKRG